MKRRWMGIAKCLAGAALIAAIFSFALGQGNDAPPSVNPVRLSREPGFYDEAFDLELYCDSGEIHYTLDSSDPGEDSPVYTGPIHIDDNSADPNVYSAIEEVSLDFKPDILAQYDREVKYGFRVPSSPVDKATVVRAVCIDALGKRSEVVTGVYFVDYGSKKGYDGINVITITTDPDNLFDYDRGIYVLGKTFDRAVEQGLGIALNDNYWFWPANFKNRGEQWERRANICLFDSERRLKLSGDFGIRIQGRGSRGRIPKSFNIYARERYGTQAFSGEALFGLDYPLTRLNLSCGADSMDTLLADYMANEFTEGMNFETRPYEPCALFLDGEFWGIYWLTPRYKEDYFAGEYPTLADDVIEVKNDLVEIGYEDDYQLYQDVFDFIADGDMSDPEQYERACGMIDIQSCIDYYATEIYIANRDWPINNFALWRTRTVSDQPCGDGKWRWLLFDVNMSMDTRYSKRDLVQWVACNDAMFCSLLDNPDYEAAVCGKLVELAEGRFAPDRVDGFIDEYEAFMADAMVNQYNRIYDGEKTRQDFLDICEETRLFFHERHDYIMEAYGEK